MMRENRKGFTMIEILVVIVIIATLASAVVLTVADKPDQAKVARAKADISVMETALENFRLDMNRYPTEEDGLKALVKRPEDDEDDRWKGPYIKRIEKDGWGKNYEYFNPGYHNTEGFDIMSYGADGQEGGDKYNADIGNWVEDEELEG
jgi:general secretion pathway protein G